MVKKLVSINEQQAQYLEENSKSASKVLQKAINSEMSAYTNSQDSVIRGPIIMRCGQCGNIYPYKGECVLNEVFCPVCRAKQGASSSLKGPV